MPVKTATADQASARHSARSSPGSAQGPVDFSINNQIVTILGFMGQGANLTILCMYLHSKKENKLPHIFINGYNNNHILLIIYYVLYI